jgi:hypothetical protein
MEPSIADPDPCVFGPPGSGSGSINQRYGSGSGSFYQQAKIVRKILITTVLFCDFFLIFYLWKMMWMYHQKVISRKTLKSFIIFLLASWRSMTIIAGSGSASESGSISQRHGSADPDPGPDPHQNVMDQQHWWSLYLVCTGWTWRGRWPWPPQVWRWTCSLGEWPPAAPCSAT